jgi:hypothetical protein
LPVHIPISDPCRDVTIRALGETKRMIETELCGAREYGQPRFAAVEFVTANNTRAVGAKASAIINANAI